MPNVSRDMATVATVAAVKAYAVKAYAAKADVAKADEAKVYGAKAGVAKVYGAKAGAAKADEAKSDEMLVAMTTGVAAVRGASVASAPRLPLAKRAIRVATSAANAARHVTNGLRPDVVPDRLTTNWMTICTLWILRMTK